MGTKSDINLASSKAPPRFRSGFYLSVAAALFILAGFSGRSPADNPLLCGMAFVFAIVGFILAKGIMARGLGVALTGVCGGFLASFIRTQYF